MSSDLKRSKSSGVKSEGGVKAEGNGAVPRPVSTNARGPAAPAASASSTSSAPRPSSPPPPTTYRDIPLLSTSLEDYKYHLMKLASFTKVDPSDTAQFPWPVKLNRKWPPKLKDELPMQGDPVIDQWGKPVMIPPKKDANSASMALASHGLTTSESKKKVPLLWPGPDDDVYEVEELLARLDTPKGPTADTSLIGPSNTANLATRAKAGLFQKRVREVYKSSSVARKTHNEEIQPWILEDYETSKQWESRKKESRRGLKALQLGIKARREGGRFPSQPNPTLHAAASDTPMAVKKEEIMMEEEETKKVFEKTKDNHAPWIGKLEGEAHESASTTAGGAMSHALFIFDERGAGGFRVVPVSRMYKFLQKPAHANNLSWEEAEKAFERHQKAQVGEGISKFLSRNTDARGGSTSRIVRTKNEEDDRKYLSSLTQSKGLQLPGSSRQGDSRLASLYDRDSSARRNNLMAVGGSSTRGIRVKDEEGTYGELDFEEDFADDEERNEGDDYAMGEEETRELEQKIKREMARAEEEERDGEDGDDDLFDERGRSRTRRGEDDVLTGSGKQMKKIMKALARREGNDVYDDDDERNPYASDNPSDDEEDTVMANPEEALRLVREEREREAEEARKAAAKAGIKTEDTSNNPSRSGTPAPKSDTGGVNTPTSASMSRPSTATQQQPYAQQHAQRKPGAGHATAAQRAASPNRRANSHSRQNSRSGSPVEGGVGSSSLKRKSEAAMSNGKRPRTSTMQSSQPPSPGESNSPRSASPSRHGRSSTNSSNAPLSELELDIIRLVQLGKAKSTKELITHFKSWLKANPAQQESFSKAVTRVLNTNKDKMLSVRPGLVN